MMDPLKTSIVLALALALVAPASALAEARPAAIADAADQPCVAHAICTPDIVNASASYDPAAGTIALSVTFVRTLPGQGDPAAPGDEVRFELAHGVSNGHCGNIQSPEIATGLAQGDVLVRGFVAGEVVNDEWAQANVVIGGSPATTVTRVLSADSRTLQYTISNPALVGADFRCFEVSENQFAPGAVVADETPYVLFAGLQPLAQISGVAAGGITGTSASIGATVDPDGAPTTAHLEFGPTAKYGSRTPESSALSAAGPFTAPLARLKPGATYHFRVVATNALGVTASTDQTFQTVVVAKVTHPPRVGGSLHKGSLATCSKGTWNVAVKPTSYRWLRGGSPIGGARAASYRVTAKDAGRALQCEVLVSYGQGRSAQAKSASRMAPR
jgi:hypothetical protein